tara:strand:+ start:101 stop:256 length:156 start_codon:yes stop_codon:yes gene_type:complete
VIKILSQYHRVLFKGKGLNTFMLNAAKMQNKKWRKPSNIRLAMFEGMVLLA